MGWITSRLRIGLFKIAAIAVVHSMKENLMA
jgi:hypothetical protein